MREIGTESSGEEIEILPPSCRSRLISPNMVSSRNATTNALLEMKHDSISQKVDKKKAIIVDAANTSGYDFLCKPYKGRCTMVEDKAVSAGIFFYNSCSMLLILGISISLE